MPLISPSRDLIHVVLSDRVFDSTRFKQEAVFEMLEHRQQAATGESTATIALTVKSYADDNGSFGVPLHDKGVPDKTVYLVADNNTVVDATTGTILFVFTNESIPDREEIIAGFSQDVALQGDFFGLLRDNSPIVIGDLIRLHIAQADAMGRFS
jgi:hypothetical protein